MAEMKSIEKERLQLLMDTGKKTIIYLTNGFQLHCRILGFDDNVIVIHECKREQEQMVYRHTVSTIVL